MKAANKSQVQELTTRRRLITNTLLSSTKVQNQLDSNANASIDPSVDLPTDENPLSTINPSSTATVDHQTNMHRLSFTVTTFPFTDPSPQNTHLNGRLLGLRFDHCSRLGSFQKPYYILLRRVEKGGDEWRVHRHTIPAFVPLGKYEEEFLPVKGGDGEEGNDGAVCSDEDAANVGGEKRKQDLPGFVRKVRHELVCWELRRSAVEFLKEELGLIPKHNDDEDNDEEDTEMTDDDSDATPRGRYGIQSIEATSFEVRQARITWTDGTIGRIKISDRGLVERAVVVGEAGRIKGVENLLVDGESRIEELVGKFRLLVGESV